MSTPVPKREGEYDAQTLFTIAMTHAQVSPQQRTAESQGHAAESLPEPVEGAVDMERCESSRIESDARELGVDANHHSRAYRWSVNVITFIPKFGLAALQLVGAILFFGSAKLNELIDTKKDTLWVYPIRTAQIIMCVPGGIGFALTKGSQKLYHELAKPTDTARQTEAREKSIQKKSFDYFFMEMFAIPRPSSSVRLDDGDAPPYPEVEEPL